MELPSSLEYRNGLQLSFEILMKFWHPRKLGVNLIRLKSFAGGFDYQGAPKSTPAHYTPDERDSPKVEPNFGNPLQRH